MTNDEAIAIIRNEYKCVDRDCDIEKSCGKCDLMMPSKEPILEAYKLAIKALEQQPFDEYGNYKYPSDVELTEPNTATSMPCEDAISREDAEECKELMTDINGDTVYVVRMSDIRQLPSITQKPIVCDDAISCEAVIEWLKAKDIIKLSSQEETARKELKALSPVTPQKYGKWIDYSDEGFVECPFCGHATNCEDNIDELHYCFYCGCHMVEPQERSEQE